MVISKSTMVDLQQVKHISSLLKVMFSLCPLAGAPETFSADTHMKPAGSRSQYETPFPDFKQFGDVLNNGNWLEFIPAACQAHFGQEPLTSPTDMVDH